jgi:hypothetical protein
LYNRNQHQYQHLDGKPLHLCQYQVFERHVRPLRKRRRCHLLQHDPTDHQQLDDDHLHGRRAGLRRHLVDLDVRDLRVGGPTLLCGQQVRRQRLLL